MKTKVVPSTLLSQFHKVGFYGRERELKEAASGLASQLKIEWLKLDSFTETTVLYEAPAGHRLRAGYSVDHESGQIKFDEFADVVVDDVALVRENREDLDKLVNLLREGDAETADVILDRYLQRKLTIKESTGEHLIPQPEQVEAPTPGEEEITRSILRAKIQEALGAAALFDVESVVGGVSKRLQLENSLNGVVVGDQTNVGEGGVSVVTLQTIDTKKLTQLVYDRGENLVESVVEARRSLKLESNPGFKAAVLKVKSLNATGELEQIGEAMSELVTSEPKILYASLDEVAECVRTILETANTANWDDQLCFDIAEGAQKFAAKVYAKTAATVLEAAQFFASDVDALPEDEWEAYKVVTGKLFASIQEGETKLENAITDITSLLKRVTPILKDEGYKRQESGMGSVGRTLERYAEELKATTLDKVEEVCKFICDYILDEAIQLGEDGQLPAEATPAAKGGADTDPNGIAYRTHKNVGKLGPYGEKPQLMAESVGKLAADFDLDLDKVIDWLSSYKEENEEATFGSAMKALREAWQLGEDGALPKEASPKGEGKADKDPNGIPYRTHKDNAGYMKDADDTRHKELDPDDYEEVEDLNDLLVPSKGKTATPEIAEALQLKDDGEVPADAKPGTKGDAEKDPNGLPYRSHKGEKTGPYGEKSKIMDENDPKVKVSNTGE